VWELAECTCHLVQAHYQEMGLIVLLGVGRADISGCFPFSSCSNYAE
jgi:hypothetical protein